VGEAVSTQERLHAFVKMFLERLLSQGRSLYYTKLVGRELVDPTHAIESVIEDGMRPQINILFTLVGDVLGHDASEQVIQRCTSSILGQLLFYYFAQPVIARKPLEGATGPGRIDALAEHITKFSMAALNNFEKEVKPS
jgi:hypothetical protein